MVADDGLALQPLGMGQPLRPCLVFQRVNQQAPGQIGLYGQCAFERSYFKRGQQGRHHSVAPQARRLLRHDFAGMAFGAHGGFDLDIQKIAMGDTKVGNSFQRRQGFARKSRAVPAAGVQAHQELPGVASGYRLRHAGVRRRGCAIQGVVVQ